MISPQASRLETHPSTTGFTISFFLVELQAPVGSAFALTTSLTLLSRIFLIKLFHSTKRCIISFFSCWLSVALSILSLSFPFFHTLVTPFLWMNLVYFSFQSRQTVVFYVLASSPAIKN
ncbi:hypothetical protein BOTBODRAFT_229223 [Botryobasidium botryosum FD-172 SS1]|uniref:Uncharacterized protein n=1 Tax=Botryobasidium botryosum (strain FD-172 SS1) TaxID=930990 RepID=A0A067M5Y7_BOTB1|nr:hypothetical protein BOTBODRAFT_229223 [Botryobasidium botryosum FD-172 SS1]